jgi:hypothetical protein
MKKNNRAIEKKLELRKETLRPLTKERLLHVQGGVFESGSEEYTERPRNTSHTIP